MCTTTTRQQALSLELHAPQIRPEAFPWGSANVEIHASFSRQGCQSIVTLPSVVDLSPLLLRGEGGHEERVVEATGSLDVEILGYDNGVTFELGSASIPLPTGSVLQQQQQQQQMGRYDHQFRVCLTGAAGVRTGVLAGTFQAACSKTSVDNGATSESIGVQGPQQPERFSAKEAELEVRDKTADDGAGRDAESDKSREGQPSTPDTAGPENQAIKLLEAATELLVSSNTRTVLQQPRPFDGSGAERLAAYEEHTKLKKRHSQDLLLRKIQAPEALPPTDIWGSLDVKPVKPDAGLPQQTTYDGGDDGKHPPTPRFPTAGFRFEPTTGAMEWHRIAAVNVSKVEREGDVQTLKQFLPEIAVGNTDEHDDGDANPGLVNAFRLAQLQAQYVLHCQQVLQRQCDGLQTAVTRMELETEGNLHGTTALRNRARLLRKESRKQDKIINGYAAMLRTHNPGLASKVVLDDKGRLKVFKAKEGIRHRGQGTRWAEKRRSRRCRYSGTDDNGDDALEDGADNFKKGNTSPVGSGFSLGSDGTSHWSEAAPPVPRTTESSSHKPGSSTPAAATTKEEAFHHQATGETRGRQLAEEVNPAAPTDKGKGEDKDKDKDKDKDTAVVADGGRSSNGVATSGVFDNSNNNNNNNNNNSAEGSGRGNRDGAGNDGGDHNGNNGHRRGGWSRSTGGADALLPYEREQHRGGSSSDELRRGRRRKRPGGVDTTAAAAAASLSWVDDGAGVGTAHGAVFLPSKSKEESLLVSEDGGRGPRDVDHAVSAATGRAERGQHGSNEGEVVATNRQRAGGAYAAVGGGCNNTREGSDAHRRRPALTTERSSSVGRLDERSSGEDSEGEAVPAPGEQQAALGRTPRLVTTVSVKPRKIDRSRPTSPWRSPSRSPSPSPPAQQQGNSSSSPASPTLQQQQRLHGGGRGGGGRGNNSGNRVVGDINARREYGRRANKPNAAAEIPAGGCEEERLSLERGPASSRVRGGDQNVSASSAVAPLPVLTADASRLGLEGDDFPDVAEFDLDDISEIDAGGEWAGSAGGSLSS